MWPTDRKSKKLVAGVTGAVVVGLSGVAATAGPASAIEGGVPAVRGEQPWYVGVLMSGDGSAAGRLMCGGTLIAPDRVLTAGHCADGASPADLTVRLEADALDDSGREIAVRRIGTHPDYAITDDIAGVRRVHNDVAVLELTESIAGRVLSLADAAPGPGSPVEGFGHGNIGPGADKSNELRRAALTVLPASACRASMDGHYLFEDDQQLCVGAAESSRAKPCAGDSGGPLVVGTGAEARLAGVASYLDRRAACDDPASRLTAYADAARFREWALSPNPVWAPRQMGKVAIAGDRRPGGTVVCLSPGWDGNPDVIDYRWLLSRVDESGTAVDVPVAGPVDRPWFTIPRDAAGHTVGCLVSARNAGGTAGAATAVIP